MSEVDVKFKVSEQGAARTKQALDGVNGSIDKAQAKIPPFQSGLAGLAGAITGPVGAATAVAALGAKFIQFSSQHATTEKQRAEFDKLNATVNSTKDKLGEAAAAALTNSGALEFLGTGVDMLGQQLDPVFTVLSALGPVFKLVGTEIELMTAPVRYLGDGIEWLGDSLGLTSDSSEELAGDLGDLGSEADKAAQSMLGLVGVLSDYEALRRDTEIRRQLGADAAKQASAEAVKAFEAETKAQVEMANAVDAVNKAKSNITYAKANRDELAAAEKLFKTASDKAALEASSATATLDQVNNYQQLVTLYETARDTNEKIAKSEERKAAAVEKQKWGYKEQNELIGGFISGATVGAQKQAQTLKFQADFAKRMAAFNIEAAVAKAKSDTEAVKRQEKAAKQERDNANLISEARKKDEAANNALAVSWINVGDSALNVVGKYADVGWAHAALSIARAATEIPFLFGTGDYVGAASVGLSAAAAVAEQSLAESMGAKKKGAAGTSASPAASVAPSSELDRGGRGGDVTNIIKVGERTFGQLAISTANKAARSGGGRFDRRLVGSTSTRRGRI